MFGSFVYFPRGDEEKQWKYAVDMGKRMRRKRQKKKQKKNEERRNPKIECEKENFIEFV